MASLISADVAKMGELLEEVLPEKRPELQRLIVFFSKRLSSPHQQRARPVPDL